MLLVILHLQEGLFLVCYVPRRKGSSFLFPKLILRQLAVTAQQPNPLRVGQAGVE